MIINLLVYIMCLVGMLVFLNISYWNGLQKSKMKIIIPFLILACICGIIAWKAIDLIKIGGY